MQHGRGLRTKVSDVEEQHLLSGRYSDGRLIGKRGCNSTVAGKCCVNAPAPDPSKAQVFKEERLFCMFYALPRDVRRVPRGRCAGTVRPLPPSSCKTHLFSFCARAAERIRPKLALQRRALAPGYKGDFQPTRSRKDSATSEPVAALASDEKCTRGWGWGWARRAGCVQRSGTRT